jgi:REP element-mobilizing transposase RayT
MTFKPRHQPEHLYFITATIVGWKPLFAQPAYARIVLDSLTWHCHQARWLLFAYVLMPNHLHALLKPRAPHTISQVLQTFGSFTAHAILHQLREEQDTDHLHFFAQRQVHDASKRHQIWQPIQAKNVYSEPFLRQKLEYIHNNPVAKGWELASDRAAYPYSSAGYYELGLPSPVPVTDIWLWWQGDLVVEDALGDAAPGDGGGERDGNEKPPEAGRRRKPA